MMLPSLFFNLLLISVWLIPMMIALVYLRRSDVPEVARALWALVIVAVPLLGPIAFLLGGTKPRTRQE
jgi:hypothetical protein